MKRALFLAVAATACREIASSSAPATVTYRARISLPYSQTTVYDLPPNGERLSCTQRYDLTGDISIRLPKSDPLVDTDGRLELTMNGTGSNDELHCGLNNLREGLPVFLAQPSGSRSRFSLDIQRIEGTSSYTSTTNIQFVGSVSGDSVTGMLTFHRWGGGMTDGYTPTTSQGIASVSLVLR